MKKLFYLFLLISLFGYSQTQITNDNFQEAINTCLTTNPVDGMCSDSEYGAMPDWDVSQVTDMSDAFKNKLYFNGDISSWNVSSVTDMRAMFNYADAFNQDIGDWDVSKVTSVDGMFSGALYFNQPIGDWNVSSLANMEGMFSSASSFNQDISSWDVSSVANMSAMFYKAYSFNQDISSWDVSNVTDMSFMFTGASSFNQNLSNWCVTNIVSEPTNFSIETPLSETNKPVWGTCPTASIDDQNQLNISIYPNPTNDKLFIQGLSSSSRVSIYNVLGKLVLSQTISKEIDVNNLQSGIYIIKIVDEQKEIVRKFIKN